MNSTTHTAANTALAKPYEGFSKPSGGAKPSLGLKPYNGITSFGEESSNEVPFPAASKNQVSARSSNRPLPILPRGVCLEHGTYTASAGFLPGSNTRLRRSGFKTATEATIWRALQFENKTAVRARARELSAGEAADAANAFDKLYKLGKSTPGILSAIVEEHIARNPEADPTTVSEYLEKWLQLKKSLGRRSRTVSSARSKMRPFLKNFGQKRLTEITLNDIEAIVLDEKVSPRTQVNRAMVLKNFFATAQKRKLIGEKDTDNPTYGLELPSVEEPPANPFSVGEAQTLLDSAWATEDIFHCTAYVAIGLFAGLRTQELHRVTFIPRDGVDIDGAIITVPAGAAKKRQARQIPMAENLREILRALRDRPRVRFRYHRPLLRPTDPQAKIVSPKLLWRFKRSLKALGLGWKENGMRSAFASHEYERTKDVLATAAKLGHIGGPEVLLDHYSGKVEPGDGEKFSKLLPTALGKPAP